MNDAAGAIASQPEAAAPATASAAAGQGLTWHYLPQIRQQARTLHMQRVMNRVRGR